MDAALAAAPHVVEGTFRVHQVQQVPIEPHISIAWLDSDERLIVRTATQVPFHTRRMLAPLIGREVKDIRVIKPRIGGGFGAKQEMLIEDIVGHLTIVTGRPVRLELTREEEFMSSRTRHPQTITFKTGRESSIVALKKGASAARMGKTVPSETPARASKSNGMMEGAIRI